MLFDEFQRSEAGVKEQSERFGAVAETLGGRAAIPVNGSFAPEAAGHRSNNNDVASSLRSGHCLPGSHVGKCHERTLSGYADIH
jgi:hypothetical protein